MAKKARKTLTFVEKMQKFVHAGISESAVPNRLGNDMEDLSSLDERIKRVLGIVNRSNRPASNMLFFVMYDIESNKVRHQVVKYLQRKGCMRVQRSIFLADLAMSEYDNIRKDLAEVQAAYENNDSILVVPISADYLRSMKVIGQKIELDVIMHSRNTLFF
ncbi:CRISPR-associated endonuclease Cas2 [Parabacteroides sp.]|uniref:CRISPR-associated endonuclease Cas2 n=1 Tax=Parabacteroides sp. TaxID=1869337 RepID=UPI003080749B